MGDKMFESALLSCESLLQKLEVENQLILDASFFLPRQQRNAQDEYDKEHIPGTVFFDIDQVADLSSSLDHMLPTPQQFAQAVGKMGVDNNTQVVIYDNNHFFAAARAWWMFRVFGHHRVQIIDGGLVRWKQLDFPLDSNLPERQIRVFKSDYRAELVFDLAQMRAAEKNKSWQIVDARSRDGFMGQRNLADTTLQPGHIPGSINIPYASLTGQQQTLLDNNTLKKLFASAGINFDQPVVTTCGSGVSAAVLALALYQLGLKHVPLYDASWAEWGRLDDTPKQTDE